MGGLILLHYGVDLKKTNSPASSETASETPSKPVMGGFNPAAALGGLRKTGSAAQLTGNDSSPRSGTNSGGFNPAAALGGLRKTGSAAKLTESGSGNESEKSQDVNDSPIDSSPPRLSVTLRRSGGNLRERAATVAG